MAGRFEAIDQLLDDAIELPIPSEKHPQRKIYRIESPSGRDGLRIERITNVAIELVNGGENVNMELLDDDEERNLYQMLLGSQFQAMLDDGVRWAWIRHAALTSLMWISAGLETAEKFWASAGNPERMAPNRETRRQQQAGSAAAKSTPQRGSTSGTNRHRGNGGRRRQGTPK